jgi:hypothetical protein
MLDNNNALLIRWSLIVYLFSLFQVAKTILKEFPSTKPMRSRSRGRRLNTGARVERDVPSFLPRHLSIVFLFLCCWSSSHFHNGLCRHEESALLSYLHATDFFLLRVVTSSLFLEASRQRVFTIASVFSRLNLSPHHPFRKTTMMMKDQWERRSNHRLWNTLFEIKTI